MTAISPQKPVIKSGTRDDRNAQFKAWMKALKTEVPPIQTPIFYLVMQVIVAVMMMILPMLYIALIAAVGYAVYLHAVNDTGMYESVENIKLAAWMFVFYLVPIVVGLVTIFFMVKPFFAPRIHDYVPVIVTQQQQPILHAVVEQLCQTLDAPVPREIVVDTQVNATASFCRGLLSLFTNDLRLTIGLPLVSCMTTRQLVGVLAHEIGHFAQGAGMRQNYIINMSCGWFARVVYERDKWDKMLADMREKNQSSLLGLLLLCIRLMIFLTRAVLWVLMFIGRLVSCMFTRQSEYDADRHHAVISGADSVEDVSYELYRINFAMHVAFEHMSRFNTHNQVPDNVPALIAYHSSQFDDRQINTIKEKVFDLNTGLFSSHPSTRNRIKSAQKTEFPGIFHFTQPASNLFVDYDKLCRNVTMHTFLHTLGDKFKQLQLVSVDQLTHEHKHIEDSQSNLQRYLGHCTNSMVPLKFNGKITDKLPNVKDAVADLKKMVAKARKMAADPDNQQWLMQLAFSFKLMNDFKMFMILKNNGFRESPKKFGIKDDKPSSLAEHQRQIVAMETEARNHIDPYATLQAKRILTALRVLHSPITDKMKNVHVLRADSKKQFLAYHALTRVWDSIRQLDTGSQELITLAQAIDKLKPQEKNFDPYFSLSNSLDETMRHIRRELMDVENPYVSSDEPAWQLGNHIVPSILDQADVLIVTKTKAVIDKWYLTSQRILADLIIHAQVIERAAGIPDLELPEEPDHPFVT